MRTRDNVADLLGHPQFIIPFHRLAQHGRLVEHFLTPMDRTAATAEGILFCDRRPACDKDQRNAIATEVQDVIDRIGRPDIHMKHHGLRPSRHGIGTMSHGDSEILVRHNNSRRDFHITTRCTAISFHHRRKIRTRICEEKIDAVFMQGLQKGFRGDALAPTCGFVARGHVLSHRISCCTGRRTLANADCATCC